MASKQGLYYYTKEEIDELLDSAVESATKFKSGDRFQFLSNLTGVTRNATSQVDIGYLGVPLPKSLADINTISITYLATGEIETTGYNARHNTLTLQDSNGNAAVINNTTCDITCTKVSNYFVQLVIKPKTGYSWANISWMAS